jgi:hypothetical protein
MKKILIILTLFLSQLNAAQATVLGTYFTYQGELVVNGQSMTGNYDFSVNVFDVALGGINQNGQFFGNVPVTNGLFTLTVDLGDMVFSGDERWLELSVRTVSGPTFTVLSPRQLISNAPYAIHSQFVGTDGVDSFAIKNGAVTTDKLANAAVTSAKLAGDSVTSAKIVNGTIETVDISSQAVTRVQIAANTIQRSEVDSTQIQERVTGTCAAGSSIRVIAQDGSVTCETDDTGAGSVGWGLTGNAGTNPATDFVGTTDIANLIFKVNNVISARYDDDNNYYFGVTNSFSGAGKAQRSGILSGRDNTFVAQSVLQPVSDSVIAGGVSNKIEVLVGAGSGVDRATISGGRNNTVTRTYGSIGGGSNNQVNGDYSTIPGGEANIVNGDNAFASGLNSQALHNGSWVWTDTSQNGTNGVMSTGDNQFLIRAAGGVGIGTNTPVSPLHVKGQGTTFGTALTEVVLAVEPKTVNDDVSLAINRLASNKESALLFTTNQSPDFDIRSINGQSLNFTNYDNVGSPRLMMRINDGVTQRIDINGNLEPWVGGTYNLGGISGGSEYRWSTLYTINVDTTNAVNVTSDRRLKDNIKELDYGLAEILSMKPVTYSMKNDSLKKSHMGLIAQEVEVIIPEIVNQRDDEMHTRSMRYAELIPVLIKATQEQQVLIEQQSNEITELKSMLKSILAVNKTNR